MRDMPETKQPAVKDAPGSEHLEDRLLVTPSTALSLRGTMLETQRQTKRPRLCDPPPELFDMATAAATAGERPPAQAQVDSRGSLTTERVVKLEDRAAALENRAAALENRAAVEARADLPEQPPLPAHVTQAIEEDGYCVLRFGDLPALLGA
jgi:hypothetical protein